MFVSRLKGKGEWSECLCVRVCVRVCVRACVSVCVRESERGKGEKAKCMMVMMVARVSSKIFSYSFNQVEKRAVVEC